MAYTKGEWLVHEWGSKYTVVEAKVRVTKKPGITMAGQKILAKEITKKADAELMAAAPAMYEALDALCAGHDSFDPTREQWEEAYKALDYAKHSTRL